MFENVIADIRRAGNFREGAQLRLRDVLLWSWKSFGLQALVVYRFGRWLGRLRRRPFGWAVAMPLYPVYRLLTAFIHRAYDIRLDQSADIEGGLYISHFGGIEVRNCRVGPHCAIYQQVKLIPDTAAGRGPWIGERVFFGPHTRVCGDIRVGAGSAIGSGSVVLQDIPPNALVIGNPGQVIDTNCDNSEFL